jgi:hypothetical protein
MKGEASNPPLKKSLSDRISFQVYGFVLTSVGFNAALFIGPSMSSLIKVGAFLALLTMEQLLGL